MKGTRYGYLKHLGVSQSNFIFRFIGWYFLANTLFFWFLGLGYLRSILSSTSLYATTFADFSNPMGKALVLSFSLINYCSYMMLLAFLPALLIGSIALLAPFKRLVFPTSICIASISVICLLVDSHIYSMFKFHLNTTLVAFLWNPQWRDVFDFSPHELLLMMLTIVLVFVLECSMAWVVWNKIIVAQRFNIGKTIAVIWLGGALYSYFLLLLTVSNNNNLLSLQTPTLPLFNQLLAHAIPIKNAEDLLRRYSEQHFSQPLFPNDPMHYPLHPMQCQAPEKPYNIILIMVDSLRADSLQPAYMPNMAKFAAISSQFENHLSGGNATQPGLFSLFYSLPSSYWTATLKQTIAPIFMTLLLKYGYDMKVIWASEMHTPPFDKTLFLNVKHLSLNGAPGKDIGNWDRYTTQKAIQFLTSREANKPFFLHLFYDGPHGFCTPQSYPTPFQPAIKHCSRLTLSNEDDASLYFNRYLNAVKFTDNEIGAVLKSIEKQGYLKNSIVIFTSDHGQEFNDNRQNYWGHAGNFTKAQVQVPFVIYWPGEKPNKISYLTSGYDLVPTLLKRLFACKNPTADYSIGQHLWARDERLPFVLAGSYVNMGLIEPDRLTTLETSGSINITDTKAAPLANAKPRINTIKQALGLMRRYF